MAHHATVLTTKGKSHRMRKRRTRDARAARRLDQYAAQQVDHLRAYYTLFVIELESRRVHLMGSTPYPDEAFVLQVARVLTGADDGVLRGHRILICDRDTKGIHDRLIAPARFTPPGVNGAVQCRARLGGLLRYYYRAA